MSLNSKAPQKRKRKRLPYKRVSVYRYYETVVESYQRRGIFTFSMPRKKALQALYNLRILYNYLCQDSLTDDAAKAKVKVMGQIWMHVVDDPDEPENLILKLERDPAYILLKRLQHGREPTL